ncbi:MAG TPA: hypothetical protein PKG65_11300, partial [Ferruginibacter sp.]|nr:hypothetical protein [Ferruginibacter sp.]
DTDVILGMGYDNTLGEKIGITLIATGFEHKDPFVRETPVRKEEKGEEKILMTLEMPAKPQPKPAVKEETPVVAEQPALQIDEKEEEKAIAEITEAPVAQAGPDDLMPTLKEAEEEQPVKLPGKTTVDKIEAAPEFFEISSASDQIPIVAFDIPQSPPPAEKPAKAKPERKNISVVDKDASNPPSSGGYLAKPAQIYVEEQPKPESNPSEELPRLTSSEQDDEPVIEMQLVVKSHQAAEEEQHVQQTQPIKMSDVEEPAMQDEAEDLRRRAMERIAKLRNLSFNINAADPNNEFETVPAYLRRNMELHNSIANVETFYSNYTVKSDDNNQAEISTINSFLDGKKPD